VLWKSGYNLYILIDWHVSWWCHDEKSSGLLTPRLWFTTRILNYAVFLVIHFTKLNRRERPLLQSQSLKRWILWKMMQWLRMESEADQVINIVSDWRPVWPGHRLWHDGDGFRFSAAYTQCRLCHGTFTWWRWNTATKHRWAPGNLPCLSLLYWFGLERPLKDFHGVCLSYNNKLTSPKLVHELKAIFLHFLSFLRG